MAFTVSLQCVKFIRLKKSRAHLIYRGHARKTKVKPRTIPPVLTSVFKAVQSARVDASSLLVVGTTSDKSD